MADNSDCAFSPDGVSLATSGDASPEVRLWDSSTGLPVGPPLRVGTDCVVNRVGFSPDGKYLAVATSDNQVQVFNLDASRRPVEDDLLLVQMLAGRSVEEQDIEQRYRGNRLRNAWETLHARYPGEFTVTREQKASWLNRSWPAHEKHINSLVADRELEELESLLREDLAERKQLHAENPKQLLVLNTALARVLRDVGKLNEAEMAARDSVAISRTIPKLQPPDAALPLVNLATILCAQSKFEELKLVAEELAGGDLLWRQNNLAWHLATSPDAKKRHGPTAVLLAEKAVAATSRTNAVTLDTLAAAYAEVGQFTNAVRVQQEAIGLIGPKEDRKAYESRLKLYQSGSPLRE